ncbi:SET domain-containing protein [Mycena olivaceomarginata]|nr:SET domain-containing protein [Mycena olivaceomarginata]
MDSGPEQDERLAYATSLVQKVFDEVYDEFRLWKRDYASRALQAVARPPSPKDTISQAEISEPTSSEPEKALLVPTQVFRVVDTFSALPAHEYATPSARNIFLGDDPGALPFIPFAGDSTFNRALFLREYKKFSWRMASADTDLEAVVVETARRLHDEHQMLYQHIDETAVLPLELLDRAGGRGTLSSSRRRDFPAWPPGVTPSQKILHPDTDMDPVAASPDKALALLVTTFCTNLNCMVGFCSTHLDPTPLPLPVAPLVKIKRLKDLARVPCGPDCFLVAPAAEEPPAPAWPTDTTQLLRTVLDYAPDTIPCDLATICARPCGEVFAQRQRILPDRDAARATKGKTKTKGWLASKKPKTIRTTSSLFDDLDTRRFTPGRPCLHDGPCDASARPECACFNNRAHCESGCRCGRKCTRRWVGCACTAVKGKGPGTCRTQRCACYLAHRECDPELCGKCQVKDAEANICQNADIQRARWKHTKVAPARWGMGLFMSEAADFDDLIIEYIGELIFDPTTDSRDPIAEHRGRNYLFELNKTLSIDGTYVGNDARYINHDAQSPNCRAKVRMVNGEHRIGIYATRALRSGEEVLFNYGNEFFQSKDAAADEPSK